MDCGMVGLDDLDHNTKHKLSGSVLSGTDYGVSKFAKTDDFSSATALLSSNNGGLQQEGNLVSFSSSKMEAFPTRTEGKNVGIGAALPYLQEAASGYSKNAGVNASMYFIEGVRRPFTPSQWLELEHQALIYQYMVANEPIPPNLLLPIRKALEFAGFSCFNGAHMRPNSLGWSPFHLGFTNSTDPEPGRCRRTDGKKWRCSRDAVPDQKYCERHINRGRHRSRKPVEGHSGHSVVSATTATTATTTTTTSNGVSATTNVAPVASPIGALAMPGGGGLYNSSSITHHQLKDLQSVASDHASLPMNHRAYTRDNNGSHDAQELNILSPTIGLNCTGKNFSLSKQQIPYEEQSFGTFEFVQSNRPSDTKFNDSSLNNRASEPNHPLRHFMDEWLKNPTDQSNTTQLSISIPAAHSDFMSATNSPTGEKPTLLSPLRLSRSLNGVQNELSQNPANWIPISWDTSIGGPLGEVLHTNGKNGSELNFLAKGCDRALQLSSSPTGILQRAAPMSLSNSSAGSSPRSNRQHNP